MYKNDCFSYLHKVIRATVVKLNFRFLSTEALANFASFEFLNDLFAQYERRSMVSSNRVHKQHYALTRDEKFLLQTPYSSLKSYYKL